MCLLGDDSTLLTARASDKRVALIRIRHTWGRWMSLDETKSTCEVRMGLRRKNVKSS
jgi:hypothetical protein